MDIVQEFIAKTYGVNHCTKVNDARIRIFMKNYGTKEDSKIFKNQSYHSNAIPPCWISLQQKIVRPIFVNSMWLNATDSECTKLQPENCG